MKSKNSEYYYTITLKTPIFLYGYTKYAQGIADSLISMSYNVKGYIDNRAKRMDQDGNLPVYSPDDIEKWRVCSSEIVVILCLQSIITQEKVADYLWKKGINRIIFVADTRGKDYHLASEMRHVYQKICMKEDLKGGGIPKYDAMFKNKQSIHVIKRFDEYVCILCPIHLIYTGMVNSTNSWQIKDTQMYEEAVSVYADKNITLEKLYSSFFDYMLLGYGDCSAYIEIYSKMSNKNKAEYFNDRVELFRLYEEAYENDFKFFIETAAIAEWNPHGYFNLKDGHHRVTYLYKKGHLRIPIIISKKDYDMYANVEKETEIKNYLQNNVYRLNNWEVSSRFEESDLYCFQVKELIAMWKFLFEKGNITENSFLDASSCLGFYAVNMGRLHAENVEVTARDAKEENLLRLIFDLSYQSHISIENKDNSSRKFDVVFAGELGKEDSFDELYKRTKKFYFLCLSRDDVIISKTISKAEGGRYQKLLDYFDGEKWMESGVIIKEQAIDRL